MRDSFSEWYGPTDEDVRILFEQATVVLDANVLLSLYRTGEAGREEVLGVLHKVADRLWLPYQAGLEYQRNRLKVVHDQTSVFTDIKAKYLQVTESLEKVLTARRASEELKAKVRELAKEWLKKVDSDVADLENAQHMSVKDIRRHDPVRNALDELFAGHVGARPTDEDRAKRVKEAERRANANIPPGYLDFAKSTPDASAGDYLIWAEILDYASANDHGVLFVTNDEKEDWFQVVGGQRVGPRAELSAEFAKVSGNMYHQLSLRRFLKHAAEYLHTSVTDATIDKVAPRSASTSTVDLNWDALLAADIVQRGIRDSGIQEALRKINSPSLDPAILDLVRKINSPSIDMALWNELHRPTRPVIDEDAIDPLTASTSAGEPFDASEDDEEGDHKSDDDSSTGPVD